MFLDGAPYGLPMCLWSIREYMHTSSWNSQSSSNSITVRPQNVTQRIPPALVTHHLRLEAVGQPKVTNASLVICKCLWISFSWKCVCFSLGPCCTLIDVFTYTKNSHVCYNWSRCSKTGCKAESENHNPKLYWWVSKHIYNTMYCIITNDGRLKS